MKWYWKFWININTKFEWSTKEDIWKPKNLVLKFRKNYQRSWKVWFVKLSFLPNFFRIQHKGKTYPSSRCCWHISWGGLLILVSINIILGSSFGYSNCSNCRRYVHMDLYEIWPPLERYSNRWERRISLKTVKPWVIQNFANDRWNRDIKHHFRWAMYCFFQDLMLPWGVAVSRGAPVSWGATVYWGAPVS